MHCFFPQRRTALRSSSEFPSATCSSERLSDKPGNLSPHRSPRGARNFAAFALDHEEQRWNDRHIPWNETNVSDAECQESVDAKFPSVTLGKAEDASGAKSKMNLPEGAIFQTLPTKSFRA